MLLATMVVLLQMPFVPAGKAPVKPQSAAPVWMADNTPAKLPSPAASRNLFPAPPSSDSDLFDRDKIRLVDLSGAPAADDDTSSDGTKNVGMRSPSNSSEESGALLAEVHIPSRVEPAPDPSFNPVHMDAERSGHSWLVLSVAQHGAATFDAWTTRRAISQGHVEMNPMLKPFAGNASIYGVIQVGPSILDYVGHRMHHSENRMLRQIWWLPQTVGTAASIFAGARNLSVTK